MFCPTLFKWENWWQGPRSGQAVNAELGLTSTDIIRTERFGFNMSKFSSLRSWSRGNSPGILLRCSSQLCHQWCHHRAVVNWGDLEWGLNPVQPLSSSECSSPGAQRWAHTSGCPAALSKSNPSEGSGMLMISYPPGDREWGHTSGC